MIFPSVAGQDVEGRSAVAVVRADVSGRGARWQCSPAALAGLVERALYEAATGDVPFDPGDTTGVTSAYDATTGDLNAIVIGPIPPPRRRTTATPRPGARSRSCASVRVCCASGGGWCHESFVCRMGWGARVGSRRPSARRRNSGSSGGGAAFLLLFAVVIVVGLLLALLRWLLAHWWILVLLLLIGTASAVVAVRDRMARRAAALERRRRLRLALTGPGGLDAMGHKAFEFAVRDLLRRDGCRAEQVGGGGDQSADVLATDPAGRRWVLQCKHKRDPLHGSAVGVGVLYALVGTNERVHRAHVPVVVTNGTFTAPARKWGLEQNVALVDREVLGRWASTGRPLWELLPRIPAPRTGRTN